MNLRRKLQEKYENIEELKVSRNKIVENIEKNYKVVKRE